jgi:hypothetical protein
MWIGAGRPFGAEGAAPRLLIVVKRMIDLRAGKPIQMAGAHAAG